MLFPFDNACTFLNKHRIFLINKTLANLSKLWIELEIMLICLFLYPYLIQKSYEILKEFPCQSEGSNQVPLACESDVLTTTLSDLVERRGSHRHLYSRFAQCQFKEELAVHSGTKTLKKTARNISMNIPMWTFKVFNN